MGGRDENEVGGERRWKRSEGEKGDENEVGADENEVGEGRWKWCGEKRWKWCRGGRDENEVGDKGDEKEGGKGKNEGKRLKKVKKRRW